MISVIVPLYNKVSFVKKALDSILSQTHRDFEVVIVDDGSTDGSAEVTEQRIAGLCNCRLFRQKNAGVGAARNRGVRESGGEFLCFLDADDWWEPTFLEEMSDFAKRYPDAALWACNYIYYKPGKMHIGVKHETGYMNYPVCYYHNFGMPIWTGAVMMKRGVFDEVGGFPVDVRLGEDFLLWSRIAHEYKIAYLDRKLAYYNNDVPASLRATWHLHAPKHHMLWHVDDLVTDDDWRALIDQLRVDGLKPYWLSKEYHHQAAKELEKVDWSRQPVKEKVWYTRPVWYHNVRNKIITLGSYCKGFYRKTRYHLW